MATLAALEGGAGLASSIITFISFSVEFGKLVRDITRTQGSPPKELEECRGYIDNVALWVEIIRKTPSPGEEMAEENIHLKAAIERCLQTSAQLVSLLSKLSGNADTDASKTLAQKTRLVVNSMKSGGKILWKRDQIRELRDKLKENREDVHAYIASRTGHHVARIMNKQLEIGGTFTKMDEKFSHAIIRLENLEFQNLCLTTQNQHLIGKVEELCDMIDEMRKHQRKGVAEVFDFILIPSLWSGMRLAASNLFRSQQLRMTNQGDEVKDIYQKSILANTSYASGGLVDGLNVQVIVKVRGKLWDERPILLQVSPTDARTNDSVLRAVRKLQGSFEFLSDLRETTRVTFVRFHRSEDQLSILESRDLAQGYLDLQNTDFYRAFLLEASNSRLDEDLAAAGFQTQRVTSQNISGSITMEANMQHGVQESYGISNSKTETGPAGGQELQLSGQNSQRVVGGHNGPSLEGDSTSQGQWAIYIERDWDSGVKVFCFYGIPTSARVISVILLHYKVLSTPSGAAISSKLPMLAFAAIGFLVLFWFAEWERYRMHAIEFPPPQDSESENEKLDKLDKPTSLMMGLIALAVSAYLSWSLAISVSKGITESVGTSQHYSPALIFVTASALHPIFLGGATLKHEFWQWCYFSAIAYVL